MTDAYPMLFEPILQPRVWGGRKLVRATDEATSPIRGGEPIGESWELADLDAVEHGRSVIRNGPWAGLTLHDAIAEHGEDILGSARAAAGGGFPLLVKVLDARENLSVQVHPTAEYARAHPDAHLKAEAWYVIDAEPDARIYRGIRPGISRAELARAIENDQVLDCIESVPARPGDCHDLPSGVCHALGAGTLVAEVQTPSDTTFRVWDWGRSDRTLHVEQALECILLDTAVPPTVVAQDAELPVGPLLCAHLVDNSHFRLDRIRCSKACRLELVTDDMPIVLMTVRGRAIVTGCGIKASMPAITTVLVPARSDDAWLELEAGSIVLRATLPDPHRGTIA